MNRTGGDPFLERSMVWNEHGEVEYLDQTRLPLERVVVTARTAETIAQDIETMKIRGAPLIGIAAVFGVALAAREARRERRPVVEAARLAAVRLARTRPTARNLFWALERVEKLLAELQASPEDPVASTSFGAAASGEIAQTGAPSWPREDYAAERLVDLADEVRDDDIAGNVRMGGFGASLVSRPVTVLTHCNAGALATGGFGTALGVIRMLHAEGLLRGVYADETRPLLQGARLTAYELQASGIPFEILPDGAAGSVLRSGAVGLVVTGADRIARNGDAANKIGTYPLAVLAHRHEVPFLVAAPASTFDLAIPDGPAIVIEERAESEVTTLQGIRVAPAGARARNPAFDWTPAELIAAIATDRGLIRPVGEASVAATIGTTETNHVR